MTPCHTPRIAVALCLALGALISLRGQEGPGAQSLEVALSPAVKVKISAPGGWTLKAAKGSGADAPPVLRVSLPGAREVFYIRFTLAAQWKPPTQKEMDARVRRDFADPQGQPPGAQVGVVEMKSPAGCGAYAVIGGGPFSIAMQPADGRSIFGEYAIGCVLVHFGTLTSADETVWSLNTVKYDFGSVVVEK